ncbi:MAG: PAS domain-containing protein, partial [Thermodesulfovibrionales bacterium]
MFRDRLIYRLFIMLLIFSAISMLSIYAVTHDDINEIKRGADLLIIEKRLLNDFISISFYMFFLSFLLSLFLSQKILHPVRELHKGALSIKEGNLITIPELKTYDELKEVIHVFNEMSISLKEKTEELERTNREITSAKDFLESVMDSIEDEIVIINRDLKVERVNKAALMRCSEKPQDITNQPCYNILHGRGQRCSMENCSAKLVFEHGKTIKTIHDHIDKKGQKTYCEIIASPIFDHNGNVIYMIEVLRDITERMRYDEELTRKNKELTALNSIAGLLPSSLTNKATIQEAIFRLIEMLGMDDGGIFLLDEQSN